MRVCLVLLLLLGMGCEGPDDSGELPPPGGCAGDELDCGGGCIDLASDVANCCACGHDCGTATCSAGVCLPETLATVPNPPADDLAVVNDDLVFATRGEQTSSGAVHRVSKSDGAASVVFRGLADYPSLAVADDGSIVVADTGQAGGCAAYDTAGVIVSLGTESPALVSMGRRCVASLTATSTGIAWVEDVPRVSFGGLDPGTWIAALPADATPDQAPTILRDRSSDSVPPALVRVGDALLWSTSDTIMQMTDGTPTPVVSASSRIMAFAADADDIVYADEADLVVHSRSTAAETSLGAADPFVRRIVFDREFVYVMTSGTLSAVDRQSGVRQQLAEGPLYAIAQDERNLYVLRNPLRAGWPQTEVVRIRKPAPIVAPLEGPFACVEPLTSCGSESCVDPRVDRMHCGDCDTGCASAEACASGECVCASSSSMCGGICVDPAGDAANCGTCDRSCGGGTCAGGDCMPRKLASFANAAVHDPAGVYYAFASEIRRVDKESLADALVTQLAPPYSYARYLAQDANTIYVAADMGTIGSTNPGGIYSVAKSGSAAPTALYVDRPDPRHVAIADDLVLWAEDSSATANAPNSKLVYAAADGTGILGSFVSTGLYDGSDDDDTRDVAVVGSTVYWLLGDPTLQRGAVVRVDLGAPSPTPTVLAELELGPYSLAVVGSELYVTGGWPDGRLVSMPLAGGAMTVLATRMLYPDSLTDTPEGGLMWLVGDSQTLVYYRAPAAAVPRVIQSGYDVEHSSVLIVDAEQLFTASSHGVFVMRR